MKVVCINNWKEPHRISDFALTIGKVYYADVRGDRYYHIVDDDANKCIFPKNWFTTLEEIRDIKLTELLDKDIN